MPFNVGITDISHYLYTALFTDAKENICDHNITQTTPFSILTVHVSTVTELPVSIRISIQQVQGDCVLSVIIKNTIACNSKQYCVQMHLI